MSTREPALPGMVIDQILGGEPVGAEAAPEARALVVWVATLQQPARPGELRGQATAVAAYAWAAKTHAVRARSSPGMRPAVSAKAVAAALVGVVGMGGIAAAADGSLPAPMQHIAHVLFGAPPPAGDTGSDDPTGGSAPVPMPTDMSASTPRQYLSPVTSVRGAPTELPVSEPGQPNDLAQPGAAGPTTDGSTTTVGPSGSDHAEPVSPAEQAGGPPTTHSAPHEHQGGSHEHQGPPEQPGAPEQPGSPEEPGRPEQARQPEQPAEPPANEAAWAAGRAARGVGWVAGAIGWVAGATCGAPRTARRPRCRGDRSGYRGTARII